MTRKAILSASVLLVLMASSLAFSEDTDRGKLDALISEGSLHEGRLLAKTKEG